MKFMKLGTRPDTFFTAESVRSVSSEISTDITIQVQDCRFLLHKFPLLSKCSLLKKLVLESDSSGYRDHVIDLPDLPGGAEAFEVCAKFCYGITITLSSLNIVPVRCAAEYLQMTDGSDRGNLVGKLEAFLNSCILRRWKDSVLALQSTRELPQWSEELGITGRCIQALASTVLAHPSKSSWYHQNGQKTTSKGWWAEDISELSIDHFWRVMIAVKSGGKVPNKLIGEAVSIYARRWLPRLLRKSSCHNQVLESCWSDSIGDDKLKHGLILEKMVSLLPLAKGSTSCSFLLKLLKAANVLQCSTSTKMELARRAGIQLEEATMEDLLIPSLSGAGEALYDCDIVMTILEEFMLQGQSPPTSPPREKQGLERRRRSRSAENLDFEGLEFSSRRSSSASHSSKLKVAKVIDRYLQKIAEDVNLPMGKLIALAEAIPDFARPDHDDLYRAINAFLKAHPNLDKSERKRLCKILNCKKLSVESCMHAAQNEMLPLRVVVQVLFLEQARMAVSGSQELPNRVEAIFALPKHAAPKTPPLLTTPKTLEDDWSMAEVKCRRTKLATLRMKLEEEDNDMDEDCDVRQPSSLMRSTSSRMKALCAIPDKPKRVLSKLWSMNRSCSQRH